jgi:chemotaxis protein histidine kinase CheA
MTTTLEAPETEVPNATPVVKTQPVKAPARRRAPAKKAPAKRPASPSVPADVRKAEQAAKLDEIRRAAKFKAEQEEAERDEWRRAEKAKKKAKKNESRAKARKDFAAKVVPYLPLVLVNSAALIGQFTWALEHLKIGDPKSLIRIVSAIVYAVAVESIALFLQFYANRALRNGDAAGGLYVAAFVVASGVSLINFSHFYNPDVSLWNLSVQATAFAFALCSLISPWLWRIHSRAEYREELKERGEIDTRMVRLAGARKVLHPYRSFMTIWDASWEGITNPAEAVARYDEKRAVRVEAKQAKRAAKVEAKQAKAAPADEKPKVTATQVPAPKPLPAAPAPRSSGRDWTKNKKWEDACAIYEAALDSGKEMTALELATAIGQRNKQLPIAARNFVRARRAAQAQARAQATA